MVGQTSESNARLHGRYRGAMLGAAIGDALGAPFEGAGFVSREKLDRCLEQPGPMRWTDDAHMTIGMAESLIACRGFDGAHMAEHFAQRYQQEPWRGYGPGPPQVFAALRHGARWDEAGRMLFNGSGSFGNGAAMRVAPAALFAYPDLDEVAGLARKTAVITHAHEWGIEGAVIQAVALMWLLQQSGGAMLQRGPLLEVLRGHVQSEQFHQAVNNLGALSADAASSEVVLHLGNSIEAVRSVPTALFSFLRSPNDFAEVVRFAISLGGDTDTIASMAGALAGAFLGEAAIPSAWREQVEHAAHLAELGERLLEVGHQVRFAG